MIDEPEKRIDIAREENAKLTLESLSRELQELKEQVGRMKDVLGGILSVRL